MTPQYVTDGRFTGCAVQNIYLCHGVSIHSLGLALDSWYLTALLALVLALLQMGGSKGCGGVWNSE